MVVWLGFFAVNAVLIFSLVFIVWVLDQNNNATYLIYFFLLVISLKKVFVFC